MSQQNNHKSKKPRRDRHDAAAARQPERPAVLSVEQFAHRKGVTKGLLSFKDRREKKRVETAKALRSYQKVMKREGYEAGTGASRKRKGKEHHDGKHDDDIQERTETDQSTTQEAAQAQSSETVAQKTKKPRTNRFQKSVQQSAHRQRQQEQYRVQAEEREKEKQQAVRRRRQRHKLLTARTSKGQPVMKNIVQDILAKLQQEDNAKSKEQEQEK